MNASRPRLNQPVERYAASEALLERASKLIPGGTQTYSKSRTQYPVGASPLYASHARGAHLWDVDDNEYVDFVSGLLCISLGYNDSDVNAAVAAQLRRGVSFSLPSSIEIDVAQQIVDMVPCAEMVRFGKNGSDATAGAIRLARAYTGRDHIVMCGYHGWQEWSIATTSRNKGIPGAVRALTHTFTYNDLESLRAQLEVRRNEVAAVILEPANEQLPAVGFLEGVREVCREHGALLIFDEIITGFRYADGGAQEHYGVTPDLCTLGKGMANGFPLSAVCGRGDIMRLMEDVFLSSTFGSEAISLAAACATLEKMRQEPVTRTLSSRGSELLALVGKLIERHRVSAFVRLSGHPSWSFLIFSDVDNYSSWEVRTLWMQECFARGILVLSSHNLNYAHSPSDVTRLGEVYDEVFPLLRGAIETRSLTALLRCDPIEPLFKVR